MISHPHAWSNDLRPIRPYSPSAYGFEVGRGSLTAAALRALSTVVDQTIIQASAWLLTGKFHPECKGLGGHGTWILNEEESYRFTSVGVVAVHPSDTCSNNASVLGELVARVLCAWKLSHHEESLFECAAAASGCDLFALKRLVRCHLSYLESVKAPRACRTGFFAPRSDLPEAESAYRAFWLADVGIRAECATPVANETIKCPGD